MKLFAKLSLILLVFVSIVPVQVLAKDTEPTYIMLGSDEVINKDYFAAGDTVRISGTVNGDAYVAGATVTVDGTINGDLLVAGGTIDVRGTIKNDIRAAGGTIIFAGPVGGNVTVGGGTVTISPDANIKGSILAGSGNLELFGSVGRGMTAGGGNVLINSPVGGDMLLATDQLTFGSEADVAGDVTYWAERKAGIPETAAIAGELTFHQVEKTKTANVDVKPAMGAVVSAFTGFAVTYALISLGLMVLMGLMLRAFAPVLTEKSIALMQKSTWSAFGLGLVTVVVLPIIAAIAFITVVGIPLGVVIVAGLMMLCLVGHLVAAYFIGSRTLEALNVHSHHAWHLVVGLVALGVLSLIPVLGWLVKGILVLIGVGALLTEKHTVYKAMRAKHFI